MPVLCLLDAALGDHLVLSTSPALTNLYLSAVLPPHTSDICPPFVGMSYFYQHGLPKGERWETSILPHLYLVFIHLWSDKFL